METDRRGFLGLIGAAVGALALPKRPAPPAIQAPVQALPAPAPGPLARPPEPEPVILTERVDYWTQTCDRYETRDAAYNLLDATYNHREEYDGPIELLNFGGQLDGPVIIKERTYDHRTRRVTVKAVRYKSIGS